MRDVQVSEQSYWSLSTVFGKVTLTVLSSSLELHVYTLYILEPCDAQDLVNVFDTAKP